MGQSWSSTRTDEPVDIDTPTQAAEPETVGIKIKHVHLPGLKLGEDDITTDSFARVSELKELAQKLKDHALDHNISVTINLGPSFRPSGALMSPAIRNMLRGVFKSVFITKLDILGEFAADIDYWQRLHWWNHLQSFITNAGFMFRNFAEITCQTVSPDTVFVADNRWPNEGSIGHLALNIEGFVFEDK